MAVAVVAGIVQCSSIIVRKVCVYVKMTIVRKNEALIIYYLWALTILFFSSQE